MKNNRINRKLKYIREKNKIRRLLFLTLVFQKKYKPLNFPDSEELEFMRNNCFYMLKKHFRIKWENINVQIIPGQTAEDLTNNVESYAIKVSKC